jgi:broad specificity phosphatase PhoE
VIWRLRAVEGTALVFGHGHMSRILAARLLGLDAAAGRLLIFDPASISIVGSEHGVAAIRTWNRAGALG